MADRLRPQPANTMQTDPERPSVPSRPPSTKERPSQDPAYLLYERVALRVLVLATSATVVGLLANSLVTYNSTRDTFFGVNTQAVDDEPTGSDPAWPSGVLLIPSDISILIGVMSIIVTVAMIPLSLWTDFDGTPVIKDQMMVLVDGIYALAWIAGVVILKAVSSTSDDSLMKYACDHKDSLFSHVAKYSSVCRQQVRSV